MSIESIPEQSKDSSIINLPRPEVGGDVESGEESLDEKEEDRTEDFSKQEIEKIVNNELETFDEISKMKNEKERRGKIGEHINQILEEFEESEKTKKDFKMAMVRIQMLDINDKLDKDDINRSWNQNQTDELIKIFEKNEAGIEGPGGFRDYFPKLHSLLTTGYKDGREKDTVSDLMANTIIKRIENGDVLSVPLQSEIRMWCQNIGMIDKNIRTDLLISALNNPGKLDEITSHELLANLGLNGRDFIRQIKDSFEENKSNSNKILKIIEVLNFLKNKKYQTGFTKSGEEAEEILDEIYNENDNFFIKTRIEQVLNYDQRENVKRNDDYDDKDLRKDYDVVSYTAKGRYNEEEIMAVSCHSKISKSYGALYNYNGTIDSFFKLDQEIKNEEKTKKNNINRLSVGDILREEGFEEENMNEEEYEKMVLTYKTLIELPMREKIEGDFDIELNNFNVREQVQFVNFLSSKSIEEVEKVKEFLNQGQDSEAKNNRIKCFFSLELGEEMGEVILSIGENLKEQPEIADLLFLEYSKIVDNINENAREVSKLYEEIFFEKKIDQNELAQAILQRASNLLLDGGEKLENVGQGTQKEIIEKIIKDFKKQTIANKKELGEFKEIAKKLNESYEKITSLEDDIQDWNNFLGEWMKNEAPKELSEENIKKIAVDIEKHKHFDSQRIREMIEFYKKMTSISDDDIKIMKDVGSLSDGDIKRVKESLDKDNVSFFGPKIKQLEKILPYQIAFERKFENIVFGKELADFSGGVLSNLDKEIAETKKEKIPEQKQLYFPVGISRNLEKWKEVFEGTAEMAKPIDMFAYLFWLNNQGEKAMLIICDEPQKYNYEKIYGLSAIEAEEFALKIGKREVEYYQKIIDTYNLSNINIIDYRQSLEGKSEKFDYYMKLAKKFSKSELLAELFSNMVPNSVKKQGDQEVDTFIEYALEELGHILSIDGTKVSHKNEARYDIIATIIKNMEILAKENNIEIYDEHGEINSVTDSLIIKIRDLLRNKINAIKNKLDRDSFECGYYTDMMNDLKKIRGKGSDGVNASGIEFNFVIPSAGSQSMAIKEKNKSSRKKVAGMSDNDEIEIISKIGFIEPYSTHFIDNKQDKNSIICKPQIVATRGIIGFRAQSLEKKEQIEYTKKVLKPLLIQYFIALENATPEYFRKAGVKDKNEILNECKKSSNVSDLIKFIQKYIVMPVISESSR